MKTPTEHVTLSSEEGESLIVHVHHSNLPAAVAGRLEQIIRTFLWLVFALQETVVSLNCRDEFPQTVDKDVPDRAMYPENEAERDRTTVRSSSRHDLSVWPPSLA